MENEKEQHSIDIHVFNECLENPQHSFTFLGNARMKEAINERRREEISAEQESDCQQDIDPVFSFTPLQQRYDRFVCFQAQCV